MRSPTKKAEISMLVRGIILADCTVVALALVLFPMWVIRPFKSQNPGDLALALAIARWSPLLTAIILVAGIALAFSLWRWPADLPARGRKSLLIRAATVTAVVLLVASTVLARINIFERMFNPVKSAKFISIANAAVEPHDMVLAVSIGGQAHAYPIRTMAYHHVVNDDVGGRPVVATY